MNTIVKFIQNLLMSLFFIGIFYMITNFGMGIDPEPMSYKNALLYFAIINLFGFLTKYLVDSIVQKYRRWASTMFSPTVEVILWLLFTLILPLTGDILA